MSLASLRSYPLDGALLLFEPQSGMHVRVETPSTKALRRVAPRAVMFAVNNACNLRCSFCSRDKEVAGKWTADTAAGVLEGLAEAGVLEVAFGGGEPFLFTQFALLLHRLKLSTSLALHVTTNGTRISSSMWGAYAGVFGHVRVSIYDDVTWRSCASIFSTFDQRWGANVLVDRNNLDRLPVLLRDLADAGCHDVSILKYIGEPNLLLDTAARARLSEIIDASPLACRISVCFGRELGVPLLHHGLDGLTDCGAGYDFVSITSDQRMRACSFHDDDLPATSAEEILHGWRTHRAKLGRAATRSGCIRRLPFLARSKQWPAVSVWQSFSGNNSGECVMVARFESSTNAQGFLDLLRPGLDQLAADPRIDLWQGVNYPELWKELFAEQCVATPAITGPYPASETPHELVAIGPNVLALGYGVDDVFPELRALAWKRGGIVRPGGIHLHDPLSLIVAMACYPGEDKQSLVDALHLADIGTVVAHGETVFIAKKINSETTIADHLQTLHEVGCGRRLSGEIFEDEWTLQLFQKACTRLHLSEPTLERLWVPRPWQESSTRLSQLATRFPGDPQQEFGRGLLFAPCRSPKRKALATLTIGLEAAFWTQETLELRATYRARELIPTKGRKAPEPPEPTEQDIQAALIGNGCRPTEFEITRHPATWRRMVSICVHTSHVERWLSMFDRVAEQLDFLVHVEVDETDPLGTLLRRLVLDLTHKTR